MPTLEWNSQEWDTSYQWSDAGDEWSEVWGGSETQWAATLLPRVRNFLPASTILEIAPGHGRWTQYLVKLCDIYIGIDLAANCIAACQERFKAASHASFFVNDGRSLPMVPDNSVDFVFMSRRRL
jgi:ubiquinone/menaquinone biosynthesis C-methylase UbiE